MAERPQEVERYRRSIQELSRRPRVATGDRVELSEEQKRELRALGYAAIGDAGTAFLDPLDPCERPAPSEGLESYRKFTEALSQAFVGDRDDAIRLMKDVLAEHPENLYAQETLGGLLIEAERFDEALELFERQIALGVERFAFLTSAGWLQEQAENYEKAENYYVRALELRPGEQRTAVKLAKVRWRLGRE